MPGDEWRISAKIQFFRKGKLCYEDYLTKMEYAVNLLPSIYIKAIETGNAYFAGEGDFCDQEGCYEKATVTYKIKKNICECCGE
jgi:hypothetical protein